MTFRESLGLRNEFLIVHSGNMGVKQGLEVILGAAQLSRDDKSLQYLIVGDGAVRGRLQDAARAMKLENVRFLPLLSDDQYKELLTASDVSLITQQKCVADIVFPSKVITLMASGRAIVASVSHTSEVARVLTKARAGLVVPAEESAGLLTAVTTLRENDSLRHEIAQNAREFARENWNRDIILARMESQLRTLIISRGTKAGRSRRIWNLSRPKASRVGSFGD
jgi:putative colanic acid biosynthesis glycosyltransferase WcaI